MQNGKMPDPGDFGKEYLIMKEMGWAWEDLMSCPFYVLDEIFYRIYWRNFYEHEKKQQV